MKYIVFPIEKLNEVPQETLDAMHLSPRTNNDNTEVLMKLVHYEELFPSAVVLPLIEGEEVPEITYPYPTYEGDAVSSLLSSPEWSASDSIL